LAYRNEQIKTVKKDFCCPECGSPLEPLSPKKQMPYLLYALAGAGAVLLLAIGAILWTFKWDHSLISVVQAPPSATPEPFFSTPQSGGQRKRINVGIELLNRPLLLFLDEPTSGLDPFSEFKMMELLRKLANTGCTVVCTTHVVENVFLMDQIAVMMKGRLVFQGSPDSVCATFGVTRFSELYAALQGVAPENLPISLSPLSLGPEDTKESKGFPARRRPSFSLPILMQRQTALFRADLKNIIIAIGQPLMIGAVVIGVAQEPPLVQFFAYIGTLWFGCSNSAQEIVRELPIYRRERLVGLSRFSYILSKLLWMGSLTALQALVLFAVVSFGEAGNKGDLWLQIAGLIFLAYAATGIGLTISTLARSAIQAVMLVPMVLIAQILFSGHTVEVRNMSEPVQRVSELMPSFGAERIENISFFSQPEDSRG
jgi:ABC transport system ATP-binding/permease protein